ncbi:hypothetical protein HK099_007602 [Clydaea vesicula]|uniref:GTP-binding protein n=1 Tax=Clydaea vesicula TaxID=447962 RepID=A0AAD5XXW1_9FUNG|nr:hypothetical protein HK099_007602 [Clydaea vesicula]
MLTNPLIRLIKNFETMSTAAKRTEAIKSVKFCFEIGMTKEIEASEHFSSVVLSGLIGHIKGKFPIDILAEMCFMLLKGKAKNNTSTIICYSFLLTGNQPDAALLALDQLNYEDMSEVDLNYIKSKVLVFKGFIILKTNPVAYHYFKEAITVDEKNQEAFFFLGTTMLAELKSDVEKATAIIGIFTNFLKLKFNCTANLAEEDLNNLKCIFKLENFDKSDPSIPLACLYLMDTYFRKGPRAGISLEELFNILEYLYSISVKLKNFVEESGVLLSPNEVDNFKAFQDFKRVKVVSGNGGDGAIAFEKSAKVAFGPPNGGNGGAGGDVLVRASKSITCLTHLSTLFRADHGSIGRNSSLHGKKGEDTEIVVPVGTVVKEVVTSNEENTELEQLSNYELVVKHFKFRSKYIPKDDRINWLASRIPLGISKPDPILVDLVEDGQTATLVKGGRAGKGNVCDKLPHFVSHDVRGPPFCLRGERGREIIVEFELKSIADAGLVGLPNAGKSSFLAAVSRAHPKIAPYPFTTLNPYIGTIDYPDYFSMTLADIPGIIKGASRNLGLGHTFLRHIERSKILVYVIDLSNEAPWEDLFTLQNELELYSAGLTSRPSIIIANKADLGALCRKNLERLIKVTDFTVIPCSARDGVNITLATKLMRSMATKV